MNSNKRQCLQAKVDDDTSAWEKAKQYIIHQQGGYIHDRLTFDAAQRTIKVEDDNSGGDKSSNTDSRETGTTSSTPISKGTILMKIPTTSLITLYTAEKSIYGPCLFQLFAGLKVKNQSKTSKEHHGDDSDDDDLTLYNSKNDLLLALFLSRVVMNTHKSCTSNPTCTTTTSHTNDKQKEHEETMKILRTRCKKLKLND